VCVSEKVSEKGKKYASRREERQSGAVDCLIETFFIWLRTLFATGAEKIYEASNFSR